MRSRDIFEQPSRAVKPRKPIGLVAVLSLILPGSGHLLLGRSRLGAGLMVAALLAIPASVAARTFAPESVAPLAWLIGRLGLLAALFAVIDAPLVAREPRWRPVADHAMPPRQAAALNFAFYGVGHWKLDERPGAWAGFLVGLPAHLALILFLPFGWTILAELVPLAFGAWAYHQATEIGSQRRALDFEAVDEDSGPKRTVRPVASLPGWIAPMQAAFAGVLIASGVVLWLAHTSWLSNRSIDRSLAVVQEPFYRNPAYGLQLEMRAPGWTFRQDDPALFLEAIHIGQKSRLRFQLAPRIPGFDDTASAETLFREALLQSGLAVRSVSAETDDDGILPAVRFYGTAMRGSLGREVTGVIFERGFRRYLLTMEWGPDHAEFGVGEWDHLLSHLQVEDLTLGESALAR